MRLERKVLALFSAQPKKTFNYKQIASLLEVRDTKGRNNIIKALHVLSKEKKIEQVNKGSFRYLFTKISLKETLLFILPSGKGKVELESHEEELIIPKKYLNKALAGDKINVSVHKKDGVFFAKVVDILERNKKEYVGVLQRHNDFGFVLCKRGSMYTDLFIEPKELKKYKDGEKVVAVFKSWEEGRDTPNGRIVKSLGLPGESETEIHAIFTRIRFTL